MAKVIKKKVVAKARRGGRKPGTWELLSQGDLRQWRDRYRVSRARLAVAMGVSSTSVQNWEVGNAVPTRRSQQRLVELMKSPELVTGMKAGASAVAQVEDAATSLMQAVGTIVGSYLTSSAGAKIQANNLPELIKSVRGALQEG